MSGSSGALPTAQPFAIVDLSIRCALTERGEAHTPFQLLYDLFDAQPIAACEGIWGFLEERSVELTDCKFIPSDAKNTKSKLLLLRIANSLLRRLSQERDTVFCGRIQMFLAQVQFQGLTWAFGARDAALWHTYLASCSPLRLGTPTHQKDRS